MLIRDNIKTKKRKGVRFPSRILKYYVSESEQLIPSVSLSKIALGDFRIHACRR